MKRFLVVTLIAFLAASALILLLTTRWRDRALTTTGRDLAARAHLIAFALNRTLQNRLTQAFTYATLPSLRGFAASDDNARPARIAAAHFELRSIVASDPNIHAATILDTRGIVILTTDDSTDKNWSARDFAREGMIGHPYASAPARDFGEAVQYYSAPILDNFGSVAGILVLRVAAQEWWSAIAKTENALVLDENGVRLADSLAPNQIFSPILPPAGDQFARALAERRYGTELTQVRVIAFPELVPQLRASRPSQTFLRDANGVGYLAAFEPLETNPWLLVLLTRDDAAVGSANPGYWEAFGWGALSGLLLAAIIYFALK